MTLSSRCLLALLPVAGLLPVLPPAACRASGEPVGTITFVESWPEQTILDLPDLPDAAALWPQAVAEAGSRIDIASFYFSRLGDGKDAGGPQGVADPLRPVLDEVARAASERGVVVRVLADKGFARTYPEVPAWLDGLDGVQSRLLDAPAVFGGGVLHAKYFLVDDDRFFIGSQNWDWRALGQIHELGVWVRHPRLASDLRRVFAMDWQSAGAQGTQGMQDAQAAQGLPAADAPAGVAWPLLTAAGDTVLARVAASPQDHLPPGVPWDLPLIIALMDGARDSVHVQLLSFGETDRELRLFDDLDRALRRAAVRGAQVRMILANWSLTRHSLPWIQSLAKVPGIEIRFTSIPEHADGFIPFARVEHAKYLTVDGRACWIGTSNWSRDYFHQSRNVGLILEGRGAARDPDRFFNLSWHGPYAETVDPCAQYAPPRRQ